MTRTPLLDKLTFGGLLALLVLAPLPYGAVETWSIALWEILVFGLLVLWGLLTLQTGQLRIELNPLMWPMLGLLLVAIIQILPLGTGDRPTLSFEAFSTTQFALKLFASLCFFLLCASFIHNDDRRELTANVIIAVCVVIALVGIGQSYIGKMLWQRGTFGPFVNRNHFAGFLELGVGLAGGLLIGRTVKQIWLAVYASAALVMCAGIALSASRGGVLALAAEVVFLALVAIPTFISKNRSHNERRRAAVLLRVAGAFVLGAAAIVGSMFLVGSEGLVQNFAQVQTETQSEQQASERFSRRNIWRATSELIREHPLLGVGLGAFQFAYTRYDQSSGAQRVEQTHNDYLQILADAGIVGGVLALTFILLLFGRGFAAAQTHDRRKRAIVLGALTGCFAIAVHSFVEFNLQITANAQLFLALAALATPARRKRNSSEDHDEE
ncbi:MAG: O-antigen ligase family protein [Acidobacteria bacterium]|nr:O-antigen ligase family protein [Acidobacteriota bacterium]